MPRNPTNNLRFKNYLFGLTSIVKILIKKKVCGTTFDSASSWSFGNDFARYVIIFGVDNHSSSHLGNLKNNVLVLGEGPTYGINGSFDSPEKRKAKFCLSLHYNANNSYLFVNGKKILYLKLTIKMLTFQLSFVLEVFLTDLVLLSIDKYLYLNGNVYDFPVDYNSIDTSDILY